MRFDKLHTSSLGCPEKEIECHSCHQKMAQRLLGQGQHNSDICQIEYTGHMAECPEISLLCPFGCRGYWKRKDIKAHLNDLALGHCQMLSTTLKRMQEEKEWHGTKCRWSNHCRRTRTPSELLAPNAGRTMQCSHKCDSTALRRSRENGVYPFYYTDCYLNALLHSQLTVSRNRSVSTSSCVASIFFN